MMDTFVFHYLSDLNRIGGTLLDSGKASAGVEYFETALDILAFSRNHDCTKESLSSLPPVLRPDIVVKYPITVSWDTLSHNEDPNHTEILMTGYLVGAHRATIQIRLSSKCL